MLCPPRGSGIVSPVTAPDWKTLTWKSNLCSLFALLESIEPEVAATRANKLCESPVVAFQEIRIGLLVDEAGRTPRFTLRTVVSPAVGEPWCKRFSMTAPPAEPLLATTILTMCCSCSRIKSTPPQTEPAPSSVIDCTEKSGLALAPSLALVNGAIFGVSNTSKINPARRVLIFVLESRNRLTTWITELVDCNLLSLTFPLSY